MRTLATGLCVAIVATVAVAGPSLLPPHKCPYPGMGLTSGHEVSFDSTEPPKPFVTDVMAKIYQPSSGSPEIGGAAKVIDAGSGDQPAELIDATLIFDVSGSRVTRIRYDDSFYPILFAHPEQSLQFDGQAPHHTDDFVTLPSTIGGAKVYHSYSTSNDRKGVIDIVGVMNEVRIGGERLRIERLCTRTYTSDSIDASLRPTLRTGSMTAPARPVTYCVEVTVIAPEDRVLEAVIAEGLTRQTLFDTYTLGMVVYEVDAAAPGTGTLLKAQVYEGRVLPPTNPSAPNPAVVDATVLVPFGETLLKAGKTYRIGFGREETGKPASPGMKAMPDGLQDFSIVNQVPCDSVDGSAIPYIDADGIFEVSGAYSSMAKEYPTTPSKTGATGWTIPHLRIKTKGM